MMFHAWKTWSLLLAVIVIFFGCAAQPLVYKPITLPKAEEKAPAADEKPLPAEKKPPGYEPLTPPAFKTTAPPRELPPRTTIDPKLTSMYPDPVTINVENMPLADFIVYALGETLKISFVMDEQVMKNKKPVSMRMPQAMSSDKAFELFMGLLEKNSLYVEQKAGALYILTQAPPAKQEQLNIRVGRDTSDSSSSIIQIFPLRHIKPGAIFGVARDLLKTQVLIQPTPGGNALLLQGQAFQVKQVIELVEAFDVPSFEEKKLFLLRLTYWQSEEFIQEITKIFKGIGLPFGIAGTQDPGPLFIPIKQYGAILVVSPDDETSKYIVEWKDKLDQPGAAGDGETVFSYKPQYSRASELVETIKKLYGFNFSLSTAATPAASALTSQPLGFAGLKMSADDNKNIVIIIGFPAVYKKILSILVSLDKPSRQVLLEATIAELTLTDELQYGVEWFIKNSMSGGAYSLGTVEKFGVATIPGLAYSFLSETGNFQNLIRALASVSKANILSTPRVTVLDNKEATIQVGQDVATVVGDLSTAVTTPGQTNVVRSYQYRTTGIILKVKPSINTEGTVELSISQEVSNPGPEGVGGSPSFFMRKISTSVVVGNGQTVALGGLMQENITLTEQKVPLLGDIPIIGNLFKSISKTKEKTELLILVTPTILSSPNDATKIVDELRKEIKWFRMIDREKL